MMIRCNFCCKILTKKNVIMMYKYLLLLNSFSKVGHYFGTFWEAIVKRKSQMLHAHAVALHKKHLMDALWPIITDVTWCRRSFCSCNIRYSPRGSNQGWWAAAHISALLSQSHQQLSGALVADPVALFFTFSETPSRGNGLQILCRSLLCAGSMSFSPCPCSCFSLRLL